MTPLTPLTSLLLIVTAVEAEAAALRAGTPHFTIKPVGVGPAAAAAATARLLTLAEAAGHPYTAVINAGIAGGFTPQAPLGATILGTRSIAADLGAESPEGFLPLETLGFGTTSHEADPTLLKSLTEALPTALLGDILTLTTVTGTKPTASRLLQRHPTALAEAMEGYGVATAAAAAGLPFTELRTISNPIGPRNKATWHLQKALTALTEAAKHLPH